MYRYSLPVSECTFVSVTFEIRCVVNKTRSFIAWSTCYAFVVLTSPRKAWEVTKCNDKFKNLHSVVTSSQFHHWCYWLQQEFGQSWASQHISLKIVFLSRTCYRERSNVTFDGWTHHFVFEGVYIEEFWTQMTVVRADVRGLILHPKHTVVYST